MVLPVPSWCHESRTFTHGNIWDRHWGDTIFCVEHSSGYHNKNWDWIFKCSHFLNIQMNVLGLFSFFQNNPMFFLVWDSGTQTHYISTLNYSLGTLILKLTISALKTIHKVLRTFHHSSFLRSSTDLSRSRLPICDQSAPASAGGLNGHQWDLSGKNLRWHSNREQNQSGWKGHRYPHLRTASQSSSSWTWENNRPSGCSQ